MTQVRVRTRPCSFAQAIAERAAGERDRNDTLAQMYLRTPDNAVIAKLLVRKTALRQGTPLLPPGNTLPLLP